jgi:hypothetical protein
MKDKIDQVVIEPTNPPKALPDVPGDSAIVTEWNYYRRMIARLLAEGHEGKWLLIKNEEIVGVWDTEAEANRIRVERFPLQPVLVKQILTREPTLRIGFNHLCSS